jgi:RNA polymerase sigma-70 factor (ECF subfamily)
MALRQDELSILSDEVDLDRDRALVERCQGGDSSAFGNLYSRYYERLYRFCLRRLHDHAEAEDAAQEAFARAWRALPNFVGERRFYPWLTVIAGNVCTDVLRRRSRNTPTSDVEISARQALEPNGADTSEDLVLAAVDGQLITEALSRLSDRHRNVLSMREGSGWTYQQIATHEGVEIGTVETLLWRARRALRREFTALSNTKGVLGGFLLGGAGLFKRLSATWTRRVELARANGMGLGMRGAAAAAAAVTVAITAAVVTPSHTPATPHSNAPLVAAAPATTPSGHLAIPVPAFSSASQAIVSQPATFAPFASLSDAFVGSPIQFAGPTETTNASGPIVTGGTAINPSGGGGGTNPGTVSATTTQTPSGTTPLSTLAGDAITGLASTLQTATTGVGDALQGITSTILPTVIDAVTGNGTSLLGLPGTTSIAKGLSSTVNGVTHNLGSVVNGTTQKVSSLLSHL